MGKRRQELLEITSLQHPYSFSHWRRLLSFFDEHKSDLDLYEIEMLANVSEIFRLYLNENSRSHIERHEVMPNIHEYLETIIQK